MTVTPHGSKDSPPNDEALKDRTEALLRSAELVSARLVAQTERLAEAIELFDREIIDSLRKGLIDDQ